MGYCITVVTLEPWLFLRGTAGQCHPVKSHPLLTRALAFAFASLFLFEEGIARLAQCCPHSGPGLPVALVIGCLPGPLPVASAKRRGPTLLSHCGAALGTGQVLLAETHRRAGAMRPQNGTSGSVTLVPAPAPQHLQAVWLVLERGPASFSQGGGWLTPHWCQSNQHCGGQRLGGQPATSVRCCAG